MRSYGVDSMPKSTIALVATLVQSERFGTSISQALRTYADAMRTEPRDSTCSCDTALVKPECGCRKPPRRALEKLMK